MSDENVQIVRRSVEHFLATGELDWDTTDEDIEMHDHDIPDSGDYVGAAGFQRWLEDWDAAWAQWSVLPEEFIDAGERVVVVIRMTATGRDSGIPVERQDGLVYTLRGGKVVRLDYYNGRDQALEAAGLAPS